MVTLPSVVKPLLKHGGCFPESRRQKLLGLLKVTPTAFCGLSHKSLPDSRRRKQIPPGQGRSLRCRRREMEGVLFGDPMPAYLTQSPSKYHPRPLGYSLGAIRSLCQSLSLRGEARREKWGGSWPPVPEGNPGVPTLPFSTQVGVSTRGSGMGGPSTWGSAL